MAKPSLKLHKIQRQVERLTGDRRQAAGLRRKIEARLQQMAANAAPQILQNLLKSGRAGWVNDPGKDIAVLVERGTGCVILDPKGNVITHSKLMPPPKPDINKSAFVQHLKTPGNELFVPYMYLDSESNVTVGIGHLLRDAEMAKNLSFIERQSGKPANKEYVVAAFNKVKNSSLTPGVSLEFRKVTSVELSEAFATILAMDDMDMFIKILKSQNNFPEFDSYPVEAKMALLDMVYTSGVKGVREGFPVFTSAVRRRNWKLAAQESHRKQPSAQRNQIVRDWLLQAARQEHFFIHPTCKKKLKQLVK